MPVEEAEFRLEYERTFKKDSEHCEDLNEYDEQIKMAALFKGELTSEQREKLFRISLQCPVHKMLKSGIQVNFRLEKGPFAKG